MLPSADAAADDRRFPDRPLLLPLPVVLPRLVASPLPVVSPTPAVLSPPAVFPRPVARPLPAVLPKPAARPRRALRHCLRSPTALDGFLLAPLLPRICAALTGLCCSHSLLPPCSLLSPHGLLCPPPHSLLCPLTACCAPSQPVVPRQPLVPPLPVVPPLRVVPPQLYPPPRLSCASCLPYSRSLRCAHCLQFSLRPLLLPVPCAAPHPAHPTGDLCCSPWPVLARRPPLPFGLHCILWPAPFPPGTAAPSGHRCCLRSALL